MKRWFFKVCGGVYLFCRSIHLESHFPPHLPKLSAFQSHQIDAWNENVGELISEEEEMTVSFSLRKKAVDTFMVKGRCV